MPRTHPTFIGPSTKINNRFSALENMAPEEAEVENQALQMPKHITREERGLLSKAFPFVRGALQTPEEMPKERENSRSGYEAVDEGGSVLQEMRRICDYKHAGIPESHAIGLMCVYDSSRCGTPGDPRLQDCGVVVLPGYFKSLEWIDSKEIFACAIVKISLYNPYNDV